MSCWKRLANVRFTPSLYPQKRTLISAGFEDYVVEDHADHVATFKTQLEAIDWARKINHHPLVGRVRHLNDKKQADHWRPA